MSETPSTVTMPTSPIQVGVTRRRSFWRNTVLGALGAMVRGHLILELPEGGLVRFGAEQVASTPLPQGILPTARLRVRSENFFRRCVLGGDIAFAESYIDGEWDSPDLTGLVAWFIQNVDTAPSLSGSKVKNGPSPLFNLLRFSHRLGHWLRPNSLGQARRNIREHYDLSNEFFALFLDPSMMYSSAKWAKAEQSLAEAQFEKNDALCRSLKLCPSDRVLEIGSGWGGWAIHAASRYGCHVTTITLSEKQFVLARERVLEAGLGKLVEVRLQDFRQTSGIFDKIVSIEMMEALGHRYLPAFGEALNRLLKPEGLLALQFITCPDSRYDQFRRGVDFIQKHIFPGSLLLSLNRVNQCLSESGNFILNTATDFGPDYAQTLRCWRATFHEQLPAVRALGFDVRFERKWEYYLAYCEAAFALRNISVVHTLHTRPNNLSF